MNSVKLLFFLFRHMQIVSFHAIVRNYCVALYLCVIYPLAAVAWRE